jgi:hypothetical protein
MSSSSSNQEAVQSKLLHHFKIQVIGFLDSLIERFPHEEDFVHYRIFLNDIIPIKDILGQFIFSSSGEETRSRIKNRDESLFNVTSKPPVIILNNPLITGEAVAGKITKFKELWKNGGLDKDDKETIWRWLDAFVVVADKYVSVNKRSR